jgi:hypothetical protein
MDDLDAGDIDGLLGDFEHIADHIDAEHERQLEVLYRDMSDAEYIKLPVDADGVPIRVGDSIEIIGGDYGVAVAIELCENGDWNVSMRPSGWDMPTIFAAESVRHHHEPTVEDVLREFADEVQRCCDTADTIAEYAKKLRLIDSEE